ncbi:hypothetical protein [Paralysiella testudinis]|uniref:Uncharacterized protein n=1 Tax=Paralysiella testudinis TaxID=2809020 RepID=A0A892ZH08_9NEIS|nr:hypothetical protein [Paralysiella testudinis]QRQ81923.1 hypothetical protein JQU52_00295 [Paralysiella testudinis]
MAESDISAYFICASKLPVGHTWGNTPLRWWDDEGFKKRYGTFTYEIQYNQIITQNYALIEQNNLFSKTDQDNWSYGRPEYYELPFLLFSSSSEKVAANLPVPLKKSQYQKGLYLYQQKGRTLILIDNNFDVRKKSELPINIRVPNIPSTTSALACVWEDDFVIQSDYKDKK